MARGREGYLGEGEKWSVYQRRGAPLGKVDVPQRKEVSQRGGVPQRSGGPSGKWGSLEKGGLPSERRGSPQTRGSAHRRRSPQRSGSPREARGTGSRGPATGGAGPSLTEVARRLCGWLLGPGWPREAGSGPISSGPAAAAPSGGARGGSGDRTTDDRPTDCAGGAERARVAGVRVRAPGR